MFMKWIFPIIFIACLFVLFSLVSAGCTDDDGGKSYGARGLTSSNLTVQKTEMDFCMGAVLYEFYCKGEGVVFEKYNCPNGCKNGACKDFTPNVEVNESVANESVISANETEESNQTVLNEEVKVEAKQEIMMSPEEAGNISGMGNISKIELKESGNRSFYSVTGKKKVRFLFIIPVSAQIEKQIDLESGEIVKTKKPWWSFLASGFD